MSEPKWTPGPWTAEVGPTQVRVYGGPDKQLIAVVGNAEHWVDAIDEWEANAHLTAAALELYDLLAAAASEWKSMNDDFVGSAMRFASIIQRADLALAKARGE